MDFIKLSHKCLPSKDCDKNHFTKFYQDSGKTFYVINSQDFIDLWWHHKKNFSKKM